MREEGGGSREKEGENPHPPSLTQSRQPASSWGWGEGSGEVRPPPRPFGVGGAGSAFQGPRNAPPPTPPAGGGRAQPHLFSASVSLCTGSLTSAGLIYFFNLGKKGVAGMNNSALFKARKTLIVEVYALSCQKATPFHSGPHPHQGTR